MKAALRAAAARSSRGRSMMTRRRHGDDTNAHHDGRAELSEPEEGMDPLTVSLLRAGPTHFVSRDLDGGRLARLVTGPWRGMLSSLISP